MTVAPVVTGRKRAHPPGATRAKPKKAAKEEDEKAAAAAAAADSATSSDSDAVTSDDDSDDPTVSSSDSEEDDASSSGDEEEEDKDGDDKEIVVDFEFHDPGPIDYLGVRTLAAGLTDGALPFDLSGLASAVVAQTRVGTVVKTEGGSGDPIAFITLFNTDRTPAGEGVGGGGAAAGAAQHRQPAFPPIPALAHLRCYLAAHAPSPSAKAALLSAWAGPHTGLLLAERLTNLPPQVAPPLHQALAMEVGWAVTDEPTDAGKASFEVDRIIYVSRAFVEGGSGAGESGEVAVPGKGAGGGGAKAAVAAKAKKGKGKAAAAAPPPPSSASSPFPPLVFARPEDEHFLASSLWAWWFRVPARAARPGDELAPVRLVACFDRAGWAAGRAGLDAAVGNAAAGVDGES